MVSPEFPEFHMSADMGVFGSAHILLSPFRIETDQQRLNSWASGGISLSNNADR
jgi:hypothetical protein